MTNWDYCNKLIETIKKIHKYSVDLYLTKIETTCEIFPHYLHHTVVLSFVDRYFLWSLLKLHSVVFFSVIDGRFFAVLELRSKSIQSLFRLSMVIIGRVFGR